MYCLCQDGRGVFVCPANMLSKLRKIKDTCLAANLEQLRPYKYRLESGLVVDKLDEGNGVLDT